VANLSTPAGQANACPAQIQSVDLTTNTATGFTRQGTTITIDLRYAVGAVHVIPTQNEQWFCKRVGQNWALDRKLPQNTDTLANIADHPVTGLVQIGSSGATHGPLLLDGSSIIADAPLQLSAGTDGALPDPTTVAAGSLAYDGTEPVFCTGAAWSPMSGGGSGGTGGYVKPIGGIPASDLAADVQAELADAAAAYIKPSGGIPASDMTTSVQSALTSAAGAYVKPGSGIPESDLASGVQADLSLAASAMQTIPNNSVSVAQLSAGGTPSNSTYLRGDNVWATPAGGSGGGTTGIYAVQTSAATTLTLVAAYQVYVFTGTATTTWTLPAISASTGQFFVLENRGSATITLVPAGTDHIYHRVAVTSVTIAPGSAYEVVCDGTYWMDAYAAVAVDNQRWLANHTDTTKLAQFDCSAITTGTTRTYTLPNLNGILESQTNKNVANGYLGADSTGKLAISSINASGTPNATTTLRGDGTWAATTSGAIISRLSTTAVACVVGANTVLPNNFFDTLVTNTSDISVNLTTGALTVSISGWYHFQGLLQLAAIPGTTGAGVQAQMWVNGAFFGQGPDICVIADHAGTCRSSGLMGVNIVTPLSAGTSIQMGYDATNAGFTITGEATGTAARLAISRINP